jgi:hypothetical protein
MEDSQYSRSSKKSGVHHERHPFFICSQFIGRTSSVFAKFDQSSCVCDNRGHPDRSAITGAAPTRTTETSCARRDIQMVRRSDFQQTIYRCDYTILDPHNSPLLYLAPILGISYSSTATPLEVILIANDPCAFNLFTASRIPLRQVSLVIQSTETIEQPFAIAANLST